MSDLFYGNAVLVLAHAVTLTCLNETLDDAIETQMTVYF